MAMSGWRVQSGGGYDASETASGILWVVWLYALADGVPPRVAGGAADSGGGDSTSHPSATR